jgi:2-oxoglutarate ferredoxin oxidoreductase subunit alpha
MKKLDGIAATFPGPEVIHRDAETMLLCWGSTVGPVLEAVDLLREQGHDVGAAVFRFLHPMNKDEVRSALEGAGTLVTIEGNYSGQLGRLLLLETGVTTHHHIGKYDGRLFTVEDVLSLVAEYLGGRS